MSSTPGVGGLTPSAGRRTIVPSDADEEEDTGFRLILCPPLFVPFASSSSPGSLCLTGLTVGMVASDCLASDCRAS